MIQHSLPLRRECEFYRKLLVQIADRKRHTLEQRLASSGLTFWDELQAEKRRKDGGR